MALTGVFFLGFTAGFVISVIAILIGMAIVRSEEN